MQARDLTDPRAWAGAILVVLAFGVLMTIPGVSWGADGTYTFSDFAIPNPNRPDTAKTLLTIDASDHVGQTCTINVDTVNGESVHPENFVTVEGVIPTIVVSGTEDGAFGEHQNTETVVIGNAGTITVVNHFSEATSVEGTITITCDTITTTTSTTVSSSSSTTTPTNSTTTTTGSSTSTTTPAPTTTVPTESTTTTVPPVSPPSTLPFTGPEDLIGWGAVGAASLLLGLGLMRASKEGRHES